MRFIKGKVLEVSFEQDLSIRLDGFSLHAAVSIPSHRRDSLERLIRYMARPPVCTERLSLNEEGQVEYLFKRPWKDGRTHVVLSPLELMEKLSSLVPLPYLNLTRYSGVLAPNSKYRSKIIPGKTRAQIKQEKIEDKVPVLQRGNWAKLLARVFMIDVTK